MAAIRAEEKAQDFALRKELTQYELGERRAMAADEMAAREKLTTMEIDSREKISAADNAARLQANREDNAARTAATRGGGSSRERAPKIETFTDPNGKAYSFDINNPQDIARFRQLSHSVGLLPYHHSAGKKVTPAPIPPDFSNVRGSPVAAPVQRAPVAPPATPPVSVQRRTWNPATGRLE